jgi:putative pyruvate formate lyase activating enzyme
MENLKAIKNYLAILEGKKRPKFKDIGKKELDKKIKVAFEILKKCELCERKCKVDRLKGELGWCKVGKEMRVSSYFEHYGEEPFLIPSFTIFFISCTFSCQYCQNWTISQRIEKGNTIEEKELAKIIDSHTRCRNINFVGGDPTPYLPFVLKTLKYVKNDMPVIWNSNMYLSERGMNLLKGVIDIYLTDFKYGNDKCAERLSRVKNYCSIVKRNHLSARKDSEVVIRHLILPNHIFCCSKPILKWISKNFGRKVIVNIMDQFRPEFKAEKYKDIYRQVTNKEFKEVISYAEKLKLNFIC